VTGDAQQLTPAARLSARLDDALMIVSDAVAGNEEAEQALDDLVQQLNAHTNVTWYFARWWDINIAAVDGVYAVEYTRRWLDLMNAYRAAMEAEKSL